MLKFTIALLILSSGLIGYRLLYGAWLPTTTVQPALAQPVLFADQSKTTAQDSVGSVEPTVAPLFRVPTKTAMTPTPALDQLPTRTLRPTPQATRKPATVANLPNIVRPAYPEVVIYGEELNPNWTIEQSVDTQINLWDTTHWFQRFEPQQERNSGATTIAVLPQADYGTIFFAVHPKSAAVYERQNVLGVSFWLNSGNNGIAPDDLAVAVVGSNQLPYWTPNDHSVFPDKSGSASETRLYFLKINRTIPANTWVNIVVWLAERQYDPAYQYVTGFYIKNDVDFRSTYYLDQVALLMVP